MKIEIAPCALCDPFEDKPPQITLEIVEDVNVCGYQVKCAICRMRGPICGQITEATGSWNMVADCIRGPST